MRINSYAKAFPKDRRIYRIDRWTIPIPGGLPLAASAWFVLLALTTIILAQLPLLNVGVQRVGWPAAVLLGPGALSITLTRQTKDGRSLPQHAWCSLRWHATHARQQFIA